MQNLKLGLLIPVMLVIVLIISLWIVPGLFFAGLETIGKQRVNKHFTREQIVRLDLNANFFGLESRGVGQLRGNGVLVLTQNELWFSRYFIREDINISLKTIREVSLVNSHLSKLILGRKLLYVQYLSATGIDAAAWLVSNPDIWKVDIESLIVRGCL